MKTLFFRCTLLTDVIVNQKSSSVGNQQTLDFIPGNSFLGIAAAALYNDPQLSGAEKFKLFHSGDVVFGDAHPEKNGVRTLRVPASYYYPKGKESEHNYYIHHGYHRDQDAEKMQLKQCRNGFYAIKANQLDKTSVKMNFAIKSAYDSEKRRSEDEKMYGYQSLCSGQSFLFEVRLTDAVLSFEQAIADVLTGRHRIGRSRTAQYGLVAIKKADESCFREYSQQAEGDCLVYADGRLIFLDHATGQPTYQPTAQDLGLKTGEIVWSLSQIRTFHYSPWNGKRMSFDSERIGIEKGSVFFVKNAEGCPPVSGYVGHYIQEGFGKVIYNPDFLAYDTNANGKSRYEVCEDETATQNPESSASDVNCNSPLIQYLTQRQENAQQDDDIYNAVNDFCKKYQSRFRDGSFASQWGQIRSIAMTYPSPEKLKEQVDDYVSQGVAKPKWSKMQRAIKLQEFMDKVEFKSCLQEAVVNLAAEMAKKSRKE